MARRTCLRCGGRVERDDIDLPRCPTCGEFDFCCEACRDEHATSHIGKVRVVEYTGGQPIDAGGAGGDGEVKIITDDGHPGYPHAGYTVSGFAGWLNRQLP